MGDSKTFSFLLKSGELKLATATAISVSALTVSLFTGLYRLYSRWIFFLFFSFLFSLFLFFIAAAGKRPRVALCSGIKIDGLRREMLRWSPS